MSLGSFWLSFSSSHQWEALPAWAGDGYGHRSTGIIGVVLVIVLILFLLHKI